MRSFFPILQENEILGVALGCPSTIQTWISLPTCLECSSGGILNSLNNLTTSHSWLALSQLDSQYEWWLSTLEKSHTPTPWQLSRHFQEFWCMKLLRGLLCWDHRFQVEMSMRNSPPGYSIPYPSPSCLIHPHTHPHTHHGCKTHPIPIPIRVSGPQWFPIPN
jgi:hypothetical protein